MSVVKLSDLVKLLPNYYSILDLVELSPKNYHNIVKSKLNYYIF